MPTKPIKLPINLGLVTSRDRESLKFGELQEAIGIYLKPGDRRDVHTLPGRTEVGDTGSGSGIDGLALCQFDDATKDRLVALTDGDLYSGTPGETSTFSLLQSLSDSSGVSLTGTHFSNRWYLGDGVNRNQVLAEDGTIRDQGLIKPPQAPSTVAALGSTAPVYGSASSGFTDGANAYDTNNETFAYLSTVTTASGTVSGWAATVASGAKLAVRFGVTVPGGSSGSTGVSTGLQDVLADEGIIGGGVDDSGASTIENFNYARLTLEISEDDGSTYTAFHSQNYLDSQDLVIIQKSITDSVDYDQIRLRATVTKVNPSGDLPVTFKLYTTTIVVGSNATAQTTTAPLIYGYLEMVVDDDGTVHRGPISNPSAVDLSAQNQVTLTRGVKANTSATHWEVYRTIAGGVFPWTAGRVGGPFTFDDDDFIDTLDTYPSDQQPSQTYPSISLAVPSVDSQGSTVIKREFYDRDTPPPAFQFMFTYGGSVVGIPKDGRVASYSFPGLPESYPPLYKIRFFSEKNDRLVAGANLGGIALFFAQGTLHRTERLARVSDGSFDATRLEEVRGAPGCVGPDATVTFNVRGDTLAAYISPYGVYVTNGYEVDRISDDLLWTDLSADKSGWVLDWDPINEILIMSTGTGDYYFHMAREHRKETNQPAITGPHPSRTTSLAIGEVANATRIYSGHATDGKVYLEQSGGTDASNAYDSAGTRLVQIKSGRIVDDRNDFTFLNLRVPHGDFGVEAQATLNWTSGSYQRDDFNQTLSQQVSMKGQVNTHIYIGLMGEWHEFQLVYTGKGNGTIGPLVGILRPAGRSSKVTLSG